MTYWPCDLEYFTSQTNPDISREYMETRKREAKSVRVEELSYMVAIALRSNNLDLAEMFLAEKNAMML